MNHPPVVEWTEADQPRSARWRSENGAPPPRRIVLADDRTKADDAYRLACEGTALLWRGDFHNARQLLTAMARRIDRRPRKTPPADVTQAFHLHRAAQNHRARILGMLLVPLDATFAVPLHRAPDVREACVRAYGPVEPAGAEASRTTEGADPTTTLVSLRELLALIGANEWRKKGVEIPALGGDRIHPHYGVFSPARGEYVDTVAGHRCPPRSWRSTSAPAPACWPRCSPGAACAGSWPPTRIRGRWPAPARTPNAWVSPGRWRSPRPICSRPAAPRWSSATPVGARETDLPVEYAVYDPGNRMLHGFLNGLADHLTPDGEGWLILSDLAEHLGLRPHAELLDAFTKAGLAVLGRLDVAPRHPRARDTSDPLHVARAAEITSLWRLGLADRAAAAS